jgi:hypothetical protein
MQLARLLSLLLISAAAVGGLGAPPQLTLAEGYYLHALTGGALVVAVSILAGGRILFALGAVAVAAVGLELVQSLLPERTADPSDVLYGVTGAVAATLLLLLLRRRSTREV